MWLGFRFAITESKNAKGFSEFLMQTHELFIETVSLISLSAFINLSPFPVEKNSI